MVQVSARRGRLDVVATPIGNLEDLTPRARAALAGADLIAAEDTRRTAQLLHALGLTKPMISLREHNERSQAARLVERMLDGDTVALVSDAGTPLLSDPGEILVAAAAAAGVPVRPIPGASAVMALLSVCGLPTGRFSFEGFLPAKASARRAALRSLATEPRTLLFFEAPHRVVDTLADLRDSLGPDRQACIGRELTKLHESLYRGNLAQLAQLSLQDSDILRGELAIAVAGAPARDAAGGPAAADEAQIARAAEKLARELPPGRAAALLADLFELPRKTAYERIRQHGPAKD